MKLNLGCGTDIKEGYVNLDAADLPNIDVIWDCNKFPYPFPDNHFDEIYAHQSLEHLYDRIKVMDELWRIAKPGGKIIISVPYFSSPGAFCHPEHMSFWGYTTFDYWDVDYHKKCYNSEITTKTRFISERKIVYAESHKLILKFLNAIITPIININRTTALIYQKWFAWILPCENLEVVLQAVKNL